MNTKGIEYAQLAKQIAEKCNLLSGPIARVEYGCQGYTGNDPDIAMNVLGENGEIAVISFSRYDQTLLGILTNSACEVQESADIKDSDMVEIITSDAQPLK